MSPVDFLLEVGIVLLSAVTGIAVWIALTVVAILLDVTAFPFPDRTTYPYETARVLGSVAVAVVSAASTWHGARQLNKWIQRWRNEQR